MLRYDNLIGIALMILGVCMVTFGLQNTRTVTNKVIEGLTGQYSSKTILYLIVGALLMLGGLILMFYGEKGQPMAQPY